MFNIFVLEDNEKRVRWFKKTFRDDNTSLYCTDSIKNAIKYIKNKRLDLIFLDRDLEKKNEYETGELITKFMKHENLAFFIPVILHSKNPKGRRRMLRHLIKYKDFIYPITFRELRKYSAEYIYEMVDAHIRGKKRWRKNDKLLEKYELIYHYLIIEKYGKIEEICLKAIKKRERNRIVEKENAEMEIKNENIKINEKENND